MKKIIPILTMAAMLPVASMAQNNALNSSGNIGIGIETPLTHRVNLYSYDTSKASLFYMQHNGVPNSTMYLGTANNSYGIDNHRNNNLLESHLHFHLSTVGLSNNMYFETGRGAGQPSPVRMMITGYGRVGIGTEAPEASVHIQSNSTSIDNFMKFTHPSYANGWLQINNGATGAMVPSIIGRAHAPSRTFGIIMIGETNDITTPSNEPHAAAILLQARSNAATPTTLTQANVFTINNYATSLLMVKANGNVGIGTTSPGTNKLSVEGTIAARKVKVTQTTPWPDYVFRTDYSLPALEEVAAHIKEKGHLPGIPTEAEVAANGHDLGEMNTKLLQKVEELTLYLLEMKAGNDKLKAENDAIRKRLEQLEKR